MSATFESMDLQPLSYDLLNDLEWNDPQLDDILAQWTNEPSSIDSTEQCVDPALLQQGSTRTHDSPSRTPFSSPQATVGAQDLGLEQRYVSYPETPSLTAYGWVPQINTTRKSQYYANPSLFGGPIDPQHDSIGLSDYGAEFNAILDIPALPSQITDTPSVLQALSGSTRPGGSSSSSSSMRKRKLVATIPEQGIPIKRSKTTTCYPSRAPKARPSNPNGVLPLSIRTAGSSIPLKDIRAQILRPAERRRKEAEFGRNSKKQAIPRPMNSFMLYRAAYTERIQELGRDNGTRSNQVVSSVAGESWRMETEEVKREFAELAELYKKMHKEAFPEYKYQPAQK